MDAVRFSYDVQFLLQAGATAVALSIGWHAGRWLWDKLIGFVRK